MKAGRNDACPCGSGKKYKKCCLANDQEGARMGGILPAHSPKALPGPLRSKKHPKPAAPTALPRRLIFPATRPPLYPENE